MSAPITAYRKKSFFTRYNNTNVEHLIAIIQQSDAIHLSRFYLDGYMPVRLDDGKEGGIGFVIIGGENATMHNLNKRGGSQRMRVGGDMVQLLNDGGLNTLAKPGLPNSQLEGGGVVVSIDYPSYYNGVTQANLVYRRTTQGSQWVTVQYQGDLNASTYYFDADLYSIPKGREIEAYMVLVNSEGSVVGGRNIFTIGADQRDITIKIQSVWYSDNSLIARIQASETLTGGTVSGSIGSALGGYGGAFTIGNGQNSADVVMPGYPATQSNSFIIGSVSATGGYNVTSVGSAYQYQGLPQSGKIWAVRLYSNSRYMYPILVPKSGGSDNVVVVGGSTKGEDEILVPPPNPVITVDIDWIGQGTTVIGNHNGRKIYIGSRDESVSIVPPSIFNPPSSVIFEGYSVNDVRGFRIRSLVEYPQDMDLIIDPSKTFIFPS